MIQHKLVTQVRTHVVIRKLQLVHAGPVCEGHADPIIGGSHVDLVVHIQPHVGRTLGVDLESLRHQWIVIAKPQQAQTRTSTPSHNRPSSSTYVSEVPLLGSLIPAR